MITLKDIEHPYAGKNKETLYLRRITLDIEKGEIVGIIGRAGSGKSALLKCINLLVHPTTGMVSVDKKNFTIMVKKDLRQARQEIGMVPQQPNLLLTKTVFSNIALPLELKGLSKEAIATAVNKVAAFVGLSEKLFCYPKQLTQAQKQKTSIARALIIKPKVLLCDEITAGLDNKTTHSIGQLLTTINQEFDTTIVIVTHDTEVIKTLCDRVCVMHQGEIVEQTNALDLFVRPKTEVAKDFIRASTRLEMPWSYRRNLQLQQLEQTHPIVRIVFTGCVSSEMLLTYAIETFQIKTIIIQAHQEYIQDNLINVLLIEIIGGSDNIESSIKHFTDNNLQVEILGYVNDIN